MFENFCWNFFMHSQIIAESLFKCSFVTNGCISWRINGAVVYRMFHDQWRNCKFYMTQFRRDLLAICGIQSRRLTVFCCFGSSCRFFSDFTPWQVYFLILRTKNRAASLRSMQHDFVKTKRRPIVSNRIFAHENTVKFFVMHFAMNREGCNVYSGKPLF